MAELHGAFEPPRFQLGGADRSGYLFADHQYAVTGQLRVHADSIEKLRASGDRIVVDLADGAPLEGDLVLNATGPSTKFTATQSVLLQNLLRRGVIAPDDTDMGIHVDFDHTVLTGTGDRSPCRSCGCRQGTSQRHCSEMRTSKNRKVSFTWNTCS